MQRKLRTVSSGLPVKGILTPCPRLCFSLNIESFGGVVLVCRCEDVAAVANTLALRPPGPQPSEYTIIVIRDDLQGSKATLYL